MECSRCSRENASDASYCSACGAGLKGPGRSRPLTRRPAQGQIAGVCAGIAVYLGVDVTMVRLLWIVLSLIPGAVVGGLIAYVAAWMLMPESSEPVTDTPPAKRLLRSFSNRKIAGVCGGLAEYFGIDATMVRVVCVILAIYPGAVIGGAIAYGIALLVIPPAPPTHLEPATA